MAITNAIMQMRRGLEADFDPDKMRPGEWAVSIDKKYVRICFSAGVCVRMATYEAFEADMAQIQKILEECQTIEDAVKLINSQVSEKLQATIEYTNQAKQYRNEAEESATNAYASANNAKSSEDKAKVSETNAKASETNAKISEENAQRVAESLPEDYTELSKAFYNTAIKQKAVGDNIHVTDSADSKIVEFGLYGKAEQKQYSGKNLYDEVALNKEYSSGGVTLKKDAETGNMIISGTANASNNMIMNPFTLPAGTYYYQKGNVTNCGVALYNQTAKTFISTHKELSFTLTEESVLDIRVQTVTGQSPSGTIKIQIEEGSSMTEYEPYVGGIPSPNPDYPQEITVSGSDGSIEVVSCGKNLYDEVTNNKSYSYNGIALEKDNDNGHLIISGTATADINMVMNPFTLSAGTYYYQRVIPTGSSILLYNQTRKEVVARASSMFTLEEESILDIRVQIAQGNSPSGTIKIQIEEGSSMTEYEPYTETVSTIPTPNGLCGIKVSSGGNYTDENGQQWICDEIVKYADGSGKRIQRIGVIESYNGEEITTDYMSTTGQLTTGAKVLYILQESITTDLSAEEIAEIEKLHTFYPITNISNDADCGMAVTYLADSKNYIDGQLAIQKAQQEAALINMLLLLPEETQAAMIENDTNNLLMESGV